MKKMISFGNRDHLLIKVSIEYIIRSKDIYIEIKK